MTHRKSSRHASGSLAITALALVFAASTASCSGKRPTFGNLQIHDAGGLSERTDMGDAATGYDSTNDATNSSDADGRTDTGDQTGSADGDEDDTVQTATAPGDTATGDDASGLDAGSSDNSSSSSGDSNSDGGSVEPTCKTHAHCEDPTPACMDGECVACDPSTDEYRCQDGDSQRCDDAGDWELVAECGGETPACLPDTGQCGSCAEDERVCMDEVTSGVCNASGVYVEEECQYACIGNTCGGECRPGALRCLSTYVPEECDRTGMWARLPECDSAQACDTETGECIGTPTIVAFSADASAITSGQATTLTWEVTGADQVSISPDIGIVSDASVAVSPTQTTTYTLIATNEAGDATATSRIAVVSVGQVVSKQHYASGSTKAKAVLIDEANQRIVTLNQGSSSLGDDFIGEHSQQNGQLQSQSDQLSIQRSNGFIQTGRNFLVVGDYGELLLLDHNFGELDFDFFEVYSVGAVWEFTLDVALTSAGTAYVGGIAALAGAGFVAAVPSSLSGVSPQLNPEFLRALAFDSGDRLFAGGDAFLGRFSTGNLATPGETATLGANESIVDVIVDGSDSVVAVGTSADGGFAVKYDPDLGDPTWRVDFTDTEAFTPYAVTVDSADNVIIAGSAGTESNDQDVVVDGLRPDGTSLWSRIRVTSTGTASASALVADVHGNVFVVGGASAALSGATGYTGDEGAFIIHVQ